MFNIPISELSEIPDYVVSMMKDFNTNDNQMKKIIHHMGEFLKTGLEKDPKIFQFFPVEINQNIGKFDTKTCMKGKYFSVSFEETSIRIFSIDIQDKITTNSDDYSIPEIISNGTVDDLFDYVALCIKESLVKMNMINQSIDYFGVSFSFPCKQERFNSGFLIKWTKGFAIQGGVGEDVVDLLTKSCKKQHLKIKSFVLINDSIGTHLCGYFEDQKTVISVINGSGTNACYIQKISEDQHCQNKSQFKKFLINTEWAAFGESGILSFVLTEFDIELDKHSNNFGEQIFEKAISGMYIGEIARLCLLKIHNKFGLFKDCIPENLIHRYSMPAPLLFVSHKKSSFIKLFKIHFNYSLNDLEFSIIYYVFDCIIDRAAKFLSAGLVALLQRIEATDCVIAVDGSMFKSHQLFLTKVNNYIKKFLYSNREILIINIEDSSGKGAALIPLFTNSLSI